MKKIILLLLSLVLAFSFVACSSNKEDGKSNEIIDENQNSDNNQDSDEEDDTNTEDKIDTEDKNETDTEDKNTEDKESTDNDNLFEGSLESILEKIYETADIDDNFKAFIKDGLMTTEITAENAAYYFGTEGIEFEEGIASDPIMSTSAYNLSLIRVKEGADIEKIKTDIKENVDPMKWVCVGVDPDNIFVDSYENVVILIMSNDQGTALHEGFLALTK